MANTENNEVQNVFYVPVNFADNGKIANGMFATRNAVEAIILVALLGYPLVILPISFTVKVILGAVILIPVGIFALIGVDGDSLSQFLVRVWKYRKQKRRLHLTPPGAIGSERTAPKKSETIEREEGHDEETREEGESAEEPEAGEGA